MDAIAQVFERLYRTLSFIVQHRPDALAAVLLGVLFFLVVLFIGLMPIVLRKRLVPVFDPHFRHLVWHVDMAPVFFDSLARCAYYAACVTKREWFAGPVKKARTFDFRSRVSHNTYRLCAAYIWTGAVFCAIAVPAGIIIKVVQWLS